MKEDLFFLGIKALIRNDEGKILLLKVNPGLLRPNPSWDGKAYWDIPGGRIKRDTTIEATLQREVEEETGISHISDIQLVATAISPQRVPTDTGNFGLILRIYSCQIPPNSSIELSEENTDHAWYEPIEAAKQLRAKYPAEFTDIISKLN